MTVRMPVAGGLMDPRIWPVDSEGPHREFGVIDLQMSLKHEMTGKQVRYVPVVPPGVRTQKIEHAYRDLLLEIKKTEWRGRSDTDKKGSIEKKFARLVKAFADALSGKRGFVRKCVLGKRVDLSGRAVIVSDPALDLDECRLPEEARRYAEGRMVLLNRAPSLHRYNLHAFTPTFHDRHVIALHPALCGRFNADFDGDTMAYHVVVGETADEEAIERMLPSRSLRSSAAGQPLVHLEQEALAGIAYLRLAKKGEFTTRFGSRGSDLQMLGREIREWAAEGPEVAREAMAVGFGAATGAGLSVGWADIVDVVGGKEGAASREDSEEGRVAAEKWVDDEVEKWRSGGRAAKGAVLALLIQSGALRNPEKGLDLLMQLAMGRGRFAKLAGGETKYVAGCLRDGLEDEEEWFAAAYGGRQGLADKKLVTPVAGSLTRDLVWAAEDLVIGSHDDCGAPAGGVNVVALGDGERECLSVEQWERGRTTIGGHRGTIRSPVLCNTRDEGIICRRCYGEEPSSGGGGTLETGYPIGLVAAQSVGERATQLAMRTFHSGGRTDADLASGLPRICALFRGQAVRVLGGPDDNVWTRVQEVGSCRGLQGGRSVARRLADLTRAKGHANLKAVCDGLVRVFLSEMYRSYKVEDVAPIHFETLLAAMLRSEDVKGEQGRKLVLEGVRQKAGRRVSFLEGLAFGAVPRRVRKLAKCLHDRGGPKFSPVSGHTFSRMLGRKGGG